MTLRISYLMEREKEEQNMFSKFKVPTQEYSDSLDEDSKGEEGISKIIEGKHKQIEADFQKLKQQFLDVAEQKWGEIKQGDDILQEIERIRTMYIEFKAQNTNLKGVNEILTNKLEAKTKLNEHLEEK